MKALLGIRVREENGFYKVPAGFQHGFTLVPEPQGKLQLVFCNRQRMRRYLKNYGFLPLAKGNDRNDLN